MSGLAMTGVLTDENGKKYKFSLEEAITQQPQPAPVSLFTNQAPAAPNSTEPGPQDYELGMRFSCSVSGTITGIRYWKAASETGTHTGRIWSNTGALLASVVFTGDTGSGWKTQALATPIAITAGTSYIVSVNANAYYAVTSGGFNSALSNNGITVPVGAGIFNTAPGAFPAQSSGNSNYFRDVVFAPGAVAAPPVEPPPAAPPAPMVGFPDATNTGVPVGTVLTTRPAGDVVLDVQGQVFDSQYVRGRINVRANNVTIKNCKLDAANEFFNIDAEGAEGLQVLDCTIINTGSGGIITRNGVSILIGHGVVKRCDISGQHHCISSNGGNVIEDNYMHDMRGNSDGHYECIYYGGGSSFGGDTIRHNHMISFDTAVVFLKTDYGAVNNCIIDRNLMRQQTPVPVSGLHATSYTIYLDGANMSGNQVTNNVMERGFYGYSSINGNTPVWSNNTDYVTGAVIALGA